MRMILFTMNSVRIKWALPGEYRVQCKSFLFYLSFTCSTFYSWQTIHAAAAAKSLQSCLTLFDPIDGIPPGFPVPEILQVRTLEWVAISFSNAWKWKVKLKSLSRVQLFVTPWTAAYHGIFQARVLQWVASAFSETIYDCDIKLLCEIFLKVTQNKEIREIKIL